MGLSGSCRLLRAPANYHGKRCHTSMHDIARHRRAGGLVAPPPHYCPGLTPIPLLAHLADFTLQHGAQLTFKAQELSNVAWACATLGYRREPLMAAVATWLVSPAMVPTLRAQTSGCPVVPRGLFTPCHQPLFTSVAFSMHSFTNEGDGLAEWADSLSPPCS